MNHHTSETVTEEDECNSISKLMDLLQSSSSKTNTEIYHLIVEEHSKRYSDYDDDNDLMEWFLSCLEEQVKVLRVQNGASFEDTTNTSTTTSSSTNDLNRLFDLIVAHLDNSNRDKNDYSVTKKKTEVDHVPYIIHGEMEKRMYQIVSSILILGTNEKGTKWSNHTLQPIQMKTLHFVQSIQTYVMTPLNVITILQRYIHTCLEADKSMIMNMDSLYLSTDIMFKCCNSILHSLHGEQENDNQIISIISLLRSIVPHNHDCHEQHAFHSQCPAYFLLLARNMLNILQAQPLFQNVYHDEIQNKLTTDGSLCLLDSIAYLMIFHCKFQQDEKEVGDESKAFEKKKHCAWTLLKHEKWNFQIFPSASINRFLRLVLVGPNQSTEIDEVLWKPMEQRVIEIFLDLLVFFLVAPFLQSDEHTSGCSFPLQSIKECILEIYSILSMDYREKLVRVLFYTMDAGVHAINALELSLNCTEVNSHRNTIIHRWVNVILSCQDIIIKLIKNENCQCHLYIMHRLDLLAKITWNDSKTGAMIGIIEANESLIEMFCIALIAQYETQIDTMEVADLYYMIQNNIFSFLENDMKENGLNSINLAVILARHLLQSMILSQELSERIIETVTTFLSYQSCHSWDPMSCYYALSLLTSLCTETASMKDHLCKHTVLLSHRTVGNFVYPLDEVFRHVKDLVMKLRLVRKTNKEPQTMTFSSGFSILAFSEIPSYIRDELKFKKNQSLILSPVSIAQGSSLKCLTKEDFVSSLIVRTRFIHMLFDSYLLMGRILSRDKKWSRDLWIMASLELISRDPNPYQLTSTCEFSEFKGSKDNESQNTKHKIFDDVIHWQTLFLAVGMLGAVLNNSYTGVELGLVKPEDVYRMMLTLEKVYFLRNFGEAEEFDLISFMNSSIFSTSSIIPVSHLLACIRCPSIITKEHSALFRAFMSGAFEQSHHEPALLNVIRLLSINSSIIANVLSVLNHDLADSSSLQLKFCDIKSLVDTISSVLLWANSLHAFFQCEPYLSGRVEVAKPKFLFEVRAQMHLYMKRALMLVRHCAEHRDFKFLDKVQVQDLIALASICDNSTIRLQLFDTVSLFFIEQNDYDNILLESSWQLLTSTMMSNDSLSDILLPPAAFQRVCHQLQQPNLDNSVSNTVMASLTTLDMKKGGEFQTCNALVHSFLAYWGCVMSDPVGKIDSFIGIIFDLNEAIKTSHTSTVERRKNKEINERGLYIQQLKQEELSILYEVTFALVVATAYYVPTLDHRDTVRKNEILFTLLDSFGTMTKNLELFHNNFSKSTIYSCIRSCHLMIDVCNDLINNFVCTDASPSKTRTSNSSTTWLSKMKIECCDRIVELSNKLSRVVSIVEKATLNALRKKAQGLSVCIYKKGTPFHMVPSSLEMFGTVEPTSNSISNIRKITKTENHSNLPRKSQNDSEESMQDDESFGATGDWGEIESDSDDESPEIKLDFAL